MKYQTKPSKWLKTLFILTPIILTLLFFKRVDNDVWYILSQGRYIFKNGIYHVDPLSLHSNFQIVVQNYLSSLLFYISYKYLGLYGIILIVLTFTTLTTLILYKICLLLSDNNNLTSMILTLTTQFILSLHFIVTRPQIISYFLILLVIYALEKYIKEKNNKYLLLIPLVSIIQVNFHASLWWMIFLFILAYVTEEILVRIFKHKTNFELKPIAITTLISFIVGFINPYGYKMITFIFTSFSDYYMHKFIVELNPISLTNLVSIQAIMFMVSTTLIYIILRNEDIRLRYIFLTLGTFILGCISIKGLSHFFLVFLFPLAYLTKNIIPNNIKENKIFNIIYSILIITGLCFTLYKLPNKLDRRPEQHKATVFINNNFDKDVKIYSCFNDGGYLEFYGFKPYIDPRAEVFLKINNKKEDIFKEYYDLQNHYLNKKKFIKKYDFDILLVSKNDSILYGLKENKKYKKIYKDKNYYVYQKIETNKKENLK